MARHVLSVGQCGFDHGKISRYFKSAYGADVSGAETFDEALTALRSSEFDLVLVNRLNDEDGAPGIELIRTLKTDPELSTVPVMLVSNYPSAQADATALGALPGFGKSDLNTRKAEDCLRAIFGPF